MWSLLKRTGSRDFCFRFLSWIIVPQALERTLGSFRISPWVNVRKTSKRSKRNTQGLGGNWFMKKTWSPKSRDTVFLSSGLSKEYFCRSTVQWVFTLFFIYEYYYNWRAIALYKESTVLLGYRRTLRLREGTSGGDTGSVPPLPILLRHITPPTHILTSAQPYSIKYPYNTMNALLYSSDVKHDFNS